MSKRGALIELANDLPKLTEKQMEALICVHPYLDGLSHKEAAEHLGISKNTLTGRLIQAYKRIPWLQDDMARKRKEETAKKESLRRPNRMSDLYMIGSDGKNDTYHGERILRKF